MMKRLGIFVFYDNEGKADRYIDYLLNDISPLLEELCIVVNGYANDESMERLQSFASRVIVRENRGFDGAAYAEAIGLYRLEGKLDIFDELVLFNDTFYGPFESFCNIFPKMEEKGLDVWGLSSHEPMLVGNDNGGSYGKHIQSYFLVIKKTVFQSNIFSEFWNTLGNPQDFDAAVSSFEVRFSEVLRNAGFNLGCYAELPKYCFEKQEDNFNYSQLFTDDMTIEKGFPVLKRKAFNTNGRMNTSLSRVMDYIENSTNYDLNLIWENVTRHFGFSGLLQGGSIFRHLEVTSNTRMKPVLVVYIESNGFYQMILDLLSRLQNDLRVICFTNHVDVDKEKLPTVQLHDTSADLWTCLSSVIDALDAENIVGLLADVAHATRYASCFRSFQRKRVIENLFLDMETISSCIHLFEKEEVLGAINAIPDMDVAGGFINNGDQAGCINNYYSSNGIVLQEILMQPWVLGEIPGWYRVSTLKELKKHFHDEYQPELFFGLPYFLLQQNHMFHFVGKKAYYEQAVNTSLLIDSMRCINHVNDVTQVRQELGHLKQEFERVVHENFLQQLALDAAPYEYGPNHPVVKSSEDLLVELINTRKSLVRFGDGEFQLMKNKERPWFQTPDDSLAEKLNEAFYQEKENVIVTIPDILGDLRKYKPADQANIRYYLKDGVREELLKTVGTERTYFDAYVSRPYLMYQDAEHGNRVFALFKELWKDKHVLLVEGEYMRSGVGNDLFDGMASLKRIICPAQNAFQYYDLIYAKVKEHLDGVDLILCALGPTATVLAYSLADTGIQTIDLGQIDNEYEWCRMGATERVPIPGKAVPEIEGQHQAGTIEDEKYLRQIVERIHC